jgi:hypothetical protein
MRSHVRGHGSRAGFSLLEVLLSLGLLGSLLGSVAMIQKRCQSASSAATLQTTANLKASRLADRVVRELSTMGATGAIPDPTSSLGTDGIMFQQALGVNAGAVQWDVPMRFALQLADGELDDGLDNDSDGLVDERALVMTRNVGAGTERTSVLCSELTELFPGETSNALDDNGNGVVDERGFSLRRVGDVMQVRVCVECASSDGTRAIASIETALHLRN